MHVLLMSIIVIVLGFNVSLPDDLYVLSLSLLTIRQTLAKPAQREDIRGLAHRLNLINSLGHIAYICLS